jgi:hypothetical protein
MSGRIDRWKTRLMGLVRRRRRVVVRLKVGA